MDSTSLLRGCPYGGTVFVNFVIGGEFYVDSDWSGSFHAQLCTFMSELDLTATDLFYRSSISFTYEKVDFFAIFSCLPSSLTFFILTLALTSPIIIHVRTQSV